MFNGENLRLARLFHGLSLEQIAEKTSKTRQYIQKIETGNTIPTRELLQKLSILLQVKTGFFDLNTLSPINEEIVHFRKRTSTKVGAKLVALAKAEMYRRLIELFDSLVELPPVNIPSISIENIEEIEDIADNCRNEWGIGFRPIDNMTRLVEKLGIFVTTFESISDEVDALSIHLNRPLIVRNIAKPSICRQRFDIAHELGHLILHEGISTGDRETESQANRFASALLLPRASMFKYFPRPKNNRIDWKGISEFKITWKVSKAAIIYRAKLLGLLTESQYKTAVITLKRKGEAIVEKEDYCITPEEPELIKKIISVLISELSIDKNQLSEMLNIMPSILNEFIKNDMNSQIILSEKNNVISLIK